MTQRPLLYSFRRCPYAIRARMALHYGNIAVEHHEVSLKDKPPSLLACSPKGTVPVLVLPSGQVIDESIDIMYWVLTQHDPDHWNAYPAIATPLIKKNDIEFKPWLDQYKYATTPALSDAAWEKALSFLHTLEEHLTQHRFLCADHPSLADFAIFPFIRQCANVDRSRFEQNNVSLCQRWLDYLLKSDLFQAVMRKPQE